MKKFVNKLIIVLGVVCFYPSFSQTLSEKISSAKSIYVAPLVYYNYYGLKGGAGLGTKPYSFTGEFVVGDVVSVTDPNISYKIVGEVPSDQLKKENDFVMAQLQEKWGADKVKTWPDDMKRAIGTLNQKDIDCDIYVIMTRAAWQSPLRLSLISSSNPDVKPVIKGGTENIKLTIYVKEKAGKKGKKVAKVMRSPYGDLSVECTNPDNTDEAASEFASKANEQLHTVIEGLLTDFYSEIEKN